ncbi:hypothetical protein CL622_00380 [archaeon]|nr:hypothetical protein [archaeon]|tara:strand:- start:2449 stop:2967 length:519 start_codon:yes stop_codon:yes gene_type:complete
MQQVELIPYISQYESSVTDFLDDIVIEIGIKSNNPFSQKKRLDTIEKHLKHIDEPQFYHTYIARLNNDTVGLSINKIDALISTDENEQEYYIYNSMLVHRIYVANTHRRQGIGTQLLKQCIIDAKSTPEITFLKAKVSQKNQPSRGLFSKLGFQEKLDQYMDPLFILRLTDY